MTGFTPFIYPASRYGMPHVPSLRVSHRCELLARTPICQHLYPWLIYHGVWQSLGDLTTDQELGAGPELFTGRAPITRSRPLCFPKKTSAGKGHWPFFLCCCGVYRMCIQMIKKASQRAGR